MSPVEVELWIAGSKAHQVVRFDLVRELGRPPKASVELRMLDYLEPRALLGQSGTLHFRQGGVEQQLQGVILSAAAVATTGRGSDKEWELELQLVSLLGSLEHSVTSRIFQDLSVPDIVKAVLNEHGIPESAQRWRLSGSYPPREYCVQYAESALGFINRLLEKEGIFYSFRAGDDGEQVLFEDDSTACDPIDGDRTVRYVPASGTRQGGEVIQRIADTHRVMSGKVVLRDYDFKRPDLDLTAEVEAEADAELALFDYPGGYVEPAEGKRYARVQLEAEQARRRTLAVHGTCARLLEGRKLELTEAPRGLEGEYLVTRVAHGYLAVDGDEPTFSMQADLLPAQIPFRRRATTPRPVIDGPQTATVMAPEGAEPEAIHCDEHGRCKVKFHWDLDEARDDRASCWIRTQQLQTSGSMVLPRVDWEVIVEFEHGDPDRPIITGRLFNGRYPPPYELPKGKTRTALRSATSPGGAGGNEIRLEDAAGEEEISVKAEKNMTLATGNNKTKSTGTDEMQSVAANRTLSVGGNQTIRVSSGFQNAVAGAQSQTIGGSRNVGVDAVLGLSAPSLSGSVGGNQFELDGNPLAGLIDLAAEKVTDKAKEKAAEKMKELDAAVKDKVDKVMGPIDELTGKLDNVKKGFEAAKNGDLGGAADAAREAAGLPTPGEFAKELKDKAVGKVTDKVTEKLNKIPGSGFAKEGAKAAGLTGSDDEGGDGDEDKSGDGDEGGDKGFVGEVQDKGFSAASGLDKMVNKGIDDAVGGAAGGLKDALGVGQGGKVVPGPPGGVSGNAAADNTCGPGHSVHKVTSTFDETIGSIRATIAAGDINTNVTGARTQSIGAARIEIVKGVRAESCATKTEQALGLVVIASGDEGENVAGAKTQSIGGALLAKVGSDA
ncbi:MAG: type VI secretion system tip protein VgrG, partial [Deltaproteobacteria bacterium]